MAEIVCGDLWQWDVSRKVHVCDAPEGCRAHFAHRGDCDSLVVEIVDGEAEVPNQLLRVPESIRCWVWDGEKTIAAKTLPVQPRAMPSDYLYTPTDVETVAGIKAWVTEQLEGFTGGFSIVTEEQIDAMFEEKGQ